MFSRITSGLLAFITGAFMASCSGESVAPVSKTVSEPDEASKALNLGVVLALTGPAGTMGGESLKGLEMAVDDINAIGDIRIAIMKYDTKTEPTEAAKLIEQVAQVDRVDAIVGPSTSPSSLRAGKLIQQLGVPAMTPTATNAQVTKAGDYMSRVCFIDPFQGEALARFALDEKGLKQAVLLIDKANDYSVGLADAFLSPRTITCSSPALMRMNFCSSIPPAPG